MSRIQDVSANLVDTFLTMAGRSKAETIATLIAFNEERYFITCRTSREGAAELVPNHRNQNFRLASLGKVFIAAAACLMIDVLSADSSPTNPYRSLEGAWEKPFTTLFNTCSKDLQIPLLYGDPKLKHLLCHYKGVRDVNHLIFSPDGTIILSVEDFLKIIPQYTKDTRPDNVDETWIEYSNANYILVAILLENFLKSNLKMSLNDFLKREIFKPLGMHHTCLSFEELRRFPDELRARPHVVSSTGERRQVVEADESDDQFGLIELATLGPYSSIEDQALFWGTVSSALDGKYTGNIGAKFINSFFRYQSFNRGEDTGYTLSGLLTTSDTTNPGCNSTNRLISPSGEASNHILGTRENGKAIKFYYLQGSATGWGSTVYFANDKRVFVIVLTNTSGLVDMSNPIAQLCFQEIFDLWSPNYSQSGQMSRPEEWKNMSPAQRHRPVVELVDRIIEENAGKLAAFENKDNPDDTEIGKWGDVCGTYENPNSLQYLHIENCEDRLRIRMRTKSKSEGSKFMRLVRNGDAYRICSMPSLTKYTYQGLGIDCFGAWLNLEFQAQRDKDGQVTRLSRQGLKLKDFFNRSG